MHKEVVEELSCRMREIGNKSIIPGLQAWRSNIMGQLTMRVSKAPLLGGVTEGGIILLYVVLHYQS